MSDTFEVANVMVALGGDAGNTVPKYQVTAAEIAVFQIIHGNDAVHDIQPCGTIKRSQRVERERLRQLYGRAKDNNGRSLVELLYPGAAARVFERLDELQLEVSQFLHGQAPEAVADAVASRQEAAAELDTVNAVGQIEGELEELEGDDEPIEEESTEEQPGETEQEPAKEEPTEQSAPAAKRRGGKATAGALA